MKKDLRNLIGLVCCITIMLSCGYTAPNSGSDVPEPIQSTVNGLTIDAAGTVPVFGGAASTSVIYIHNNTNSSISGIIYTAVDSNNPSVVKSLKLAMNNANNSILNPQSTSACAIIEPMQGCAIGFTTAVPTQPDFSGSILITATYTSNQKSVSFSRVINYETVDLSADGVVVTSGLSMYPLTNAPTYGVLYAYGSGTNINKIYNVLSVSTNNAGVTITHGDISNTQLASHDIQAIEVFLANPPKNNSSISVAITVVSNDVSSPLTNYSSSVGIAFVVLPSANGAVLQSGGILVTNITNNTTGTFFIYNAGNATATAISPSPASQIAVVAGGTCGATLAANTGCSINFNITSPSIFGSAIITIGYSGGITASIPALISWYSTNGPLLAISASQNPVVFNASESQNVIVTVTNVGSLPITATAPVAPVIAGGVGTAALVTGGTDTCSGATLTVSGVSASCTYRVNVNAATATSGSIKFGITGNYLDAASASQTYNRILNVMYTVVAFSASLTASVPAFTILGDNIDSQIRTVTITNIGSAPAILSADSVLNTTGYATVLSGSSCSSPLAPGASCTTRTITHGPTFNNTGSTINVTGTGINFNYSIPYSGGSQTLTTAVANLTTTITSNANLVISAFGASNTSSGAGTAASHYKFSGASPTGQTVTLTYKNTGTMPIMITGVQNTNSGYLWSIDTTASTCYTSNIPSFTVNIDSTCTVIFRNVISTNFIALGNVGATYAMDLTLPTITYVTNPGGVQFQQIPLASGASSIYVDSLQATLTSTAVQTGTIAGSGTVTITNTFANVSGYSQIVVTSTMEDYFTGSPVMTICTQNTTTSSILTQICTLTSASAGTGVYSLASYLTAGTVLHVNFALTSVTPSGAVVSFSPTSVALQLN